MSIQAPVQQVSVIATARLHMGFLDLNGGLGRRFGSVGLSLDQPATRLTVAPAGGFSAEGFSSGRVLRIAQEFAEQAGLSSGADILVDAAIPEHAGLGSGTQISLAVGVALARLNRLPLTTREIAAMTGRGARSGIGVGAFEAGGLLVDGGRGEITKVPPLIARMAFPEAWRVLLIFDAAATGVHGGEESEAFRALPAFPADQSAEICRRLLMQGLPSLAEGDLPGFGAAIHALQCFVGDHFAAAQGGGRYTSSSVGCVLEWLRSRGIGCVGQSSWGPTGFAVIAGEAEAQGVMRDCRDRYSQFEGLSFLICRARNQGGVVDVVF
jgi:beta-RFAP synthase